MAAFRNRLLQLASGQTDLDAVVSTVETAARTSLVDAESILDELDVAFNDNIIDFESFDILKKSVVTTILEMDSSDQKLDFDLTVVPADNDESTQIVNSVPGSTNPSGAAGAESIDVKPGMLLRDRFYVDEVIGTGGMGTVFKGRDALKLEAQDRNPYIAIKVLNEDVKERPDAFIALQREASRQQRLAHPNIATVYDFDRVGGVIFITMELLEGTPLDEYIDDEVIPRGGLSFEEALPIITSLGNGLHYAHNSHIIHSDFKPSNCFLTSDKGVKILDFGIARAVSKPGQKTKTIFDGSNLGGMTPCYASCEMLESLGDPHPSDDVYALACVAYELLTGKHPFNRLPANTAADNNLRPARVQKLTRSQNRALARGVAFRRADRTSSAAEFVRELAGTTADAKSLRIAAIASFTAVLVVAVSFGLSQYRQSQLDNIIKSLVSADRLAVESALQQIAALDLDERQQILNQPAAKDRITTFFEQGITAQATALDFLGVNETLARARTLYSDSARIENAAERAIEEKNRLLGELIESYESLLQSKILLPNSDHDNIPNVIERVKKIDPQHSLITDARLASTYAQEADRLISELDFNGAVAIIDAGLLLAPANVALINTQDRLDRERIIAARRARAQQLEIKLAAEVARSKTLQSFKPLAKNLIALAALAPGSAVITQAREHIGPAIEDRLEALESDLKLKLLVELNSEYARLLSAIGLTALSERVAALHDATVARVDGLANGIADAIAWGNLDTPADNNANSQLVALRAIAPDDSRADNLHEKLINAYVSRAHDKMLAGAFDDARDQLVRARKQQPSPNLDSLLQTSLANIIRAESQAKQLLASEGQKRAEQEKQDRIAALEQQLKTETDAAKTIGDGRQILQKLSRLEAIAPANQLIKATRDTLAEKLSAAAIDKGTNGGDWNTALKDVKYVDSLFPDSAAAAKARTHIETERAKAQTLAKQNEIKRLRANLTELATAKPDQAWSQDTTALLTKLAVRVSTEDPWLARMRIQLTDIYLNEAATLRSSQRFTLASQQLERAEKINPGAAPIEMARVDLKLRMAEFVTAQRKKDVAARIEALKQTFVAHIKAKQPSSAKKTLALLTTGISGDDPFVTSEAPTLLAGVYVQFANSKNVQKDFDAAIEFAEAGLQYKPDNTELLAALKTAKTALARIRETAAARPQPTAKPVAPKPAVIVVPTPAPVATTRITEQQVFGNWCSDEVNLTLAANNFTFYLPGGGSASYPIKRYEFAEDTFTIEWSDKQRGAMETQFGNLASDNSSLVQLRGRNISENKWNVYNRPFRRCP